MLDLEALLAPISDDAPTGPDLREAPDDVTLSEIAELRREVDPRVDPDGARAANWRAVRSACEEALTQRSKDLQIAGWLAESLARTEGYAGLAAGLRVLSELLERHWDDVNPRGEVDADGNASYAGRAGSLNWLSAARGMLPSVRAIGILSGQSGDRAEWLSWESFLEAQRVDEAAASNKARHDEMVAAGAITMKRWRQAGRATPPERLADGYQALLAAQAELRALTELCEKRFPSEDAPSFLELSGLLAEIAEWLAPKLPASAGAPAEAAEAAAADALESSSAEGERAVRTSQGRGTGPIATREEAFARLREVADYFRGAEPHSPIALLVERAVRWGNLSFPQLLQEMVKSDDNLAPIWDVLGISAPERAAGSASADSGGGESSGDSQPGAEESSPSEDDSGWGSSSDE